MWGRCRSVEGEGESQFQGMKVGLEGLYCLNGLCMLTSYSKVISISADLNMWNRGL